MGKRKRSDAGWESKDTVGQGRIGASMHKPVNTIKEFVTALNSHLIEQMISGSDGIGIGFPILQRLLGGHPFRSNSIDRDILRQDLLFINVLFCSERPQLPTRTGR